MAFYTEGTSKHEIFSTRRWRYMQRADLKNSSDKYEHLWFPATRVEVINVQNPGLDGFGCEHAVSGLMRGFCS